MSHEAPEVEVRSRQELRAWLETNHAASGPVWLVSYKKHHPDYLPYDDMVEELLCFGWIDSLARPGDADRSKIYLSPRNRGSNWSGANKRRVAKLEKAAS